MEVHCEVSAVIADQSTKREGGRPLKFRQLVEAGYFGAARQDQPFYRVLVAEVCVGVQLMWATQVAHVKFCL